MVRTRFVAMAALVLCTVAALSPNALACNGACCLPDNTCEPLCYDYECEALGGDPYGDLFWCSEISCEPAGPECPAFGGPGGVANCDCPDYYAIETHETMDPASPVIYNVRGYITGGNLQIHPPIQ